MHQAFLASKPPIKDALQGLAWPDDLLHTLACDCAERVLLRYEAMTGEKLYGLREALAFKRLWQANQAPATKRVQASQRTRERLMTLIRDPSRRGLHSPLRYVCGSVLFALARSGQKAALDTTAEAARATAWMTTNQEFPYDSSSASVFMLGPPPSTSSDDPDFRSDWDKAYEGEQQWQLSHLNALYEQLAEERASLLSTLNHRLSDIRLRAEGVLEHLEDSLFTP